MAMGKKTSLFFRIVGQCRARVGFAPELPVNDVALGLTPETDPVVMVDGPGPTLCFHLRKGPRPHRNRLHLDLAAENPAAEVARLVGLGARVWREEATYTTLRDPEGNPFCVVGG